MSVKPSVTQIKAEKNASDKDKEKGKDKRDGKEGKGPRGSQEQSEEDD